MEVYRENLHYHWLISDKPQKVSQSAPTFYVLMRFFLTLDKMSARGKRRENSRSKTNRFLFIDFRRRSYVSFTVEKEILAFHFLHVFSFQS